MTLDEAVRELKKLAGKDHWFMSYEVADYYHKNTPQIHCYIDREGVYHAPWSKTYAGAIENLRKHIAKEKGDPAPDDLDAAVEATKVEMAGGSDDRQAGIV